jgi:eukaryotic-like serine/threonine-protein kinase
MMDFLQPPDPSQAQPARVRDSARKPRARASGATAKPKVGFVEGTRPKFSEETASLLRSRLKAASLVLTILLFAAIVGNLFAEDAPLIGMRGLVLVGFIGSYFILRSRIPFSLFQLRCFEVGLFSALALQLLLMMYSRIADFAQAADAISLVATEHAYLAAWAILILTYGILMPNTWKRAVAILLPTACLPYLLLFWLRGYLPELAEAAHADKMGAMPVPFVAVLVAAFGTYIITSVRQEAFKARQLGQYCLKRKLGAGGMGEVYQAEHQLLKRPCAVKLIKPDQKTDREALLRFEREVQSTAKLTHWNTVEIYDYGHADDGTFYYVMELLPGLSLEKLVKQHGPLPPQRAIHFLRQICKALREAHAKGLIHRDIKPANIIAAERGGVYDVAKLLDFGLVREQTSALDNVALTQPGAFSGSPAYMCPEQVKAYNKLDARSDIYSLGAVAYYLVTGKPPFVRDDAWEIILAHSRDPLVPPTEVNPAVPADLELVIIHSMAKLPANRYQDAESLEKALACCSCAGKWTDDQAAAWWQESGNRSMS